MDIIGIDIGSRHMGLARMSGDGRLIASRQVALDCFSEDIKKRMLRAVTSVSEIVADIPGHERFHAFIERAPYVQNHQTHALLNRFTGAIEIWLISDVRCQSITLLSPAEIKVAFTGNAKATKEQMQQVARMEYGRGFGPDETDAIAVTRAGFARLKAEAMGE